MAYVYPAILYPEPDGRYSVVFPDLNDLSTFGDNIADALDMAQDACCLNLFNMLKDGEKLPVPSDPQSIHPEDGGFVTLVLCDKEKQKKAGTKVYAALLESLNGDGYAIRVPDVSGCVTTGKDLVEAMDNIRDALCGCLCVLEDEGQPIPKSTAPEKIGDGKQTVVLVRVDTDQ